jgi:hypothetical protein
MIIFPFVRAFYATQPMPSMGQLVALQLFLRGPVFVGICMMLARMINAPRMTTAVTVGITFALISGVAPLIVPNPLFPDSVRWVHFYEVTLANFLFGILVTLLWAKNVAETQRTQRWAETEPPPANLSNRSAPLR